MAVSGIKVLIVDNYDSFTYNIAHIVKTFPGSNLQIIEAGKIDLEEITRFDKIIFSPGPDFPRKGNIMELILKNYAGLKSILGICLGMQAIVMFYGGKLKQLDTVIHGMKKDIFQTGKYSKMLTDIPLTFMAGLYHSWTADPDHIPDNLEITAMSSEKIIMGIREKNCDIEAVQFHPESIMTPEGEKMIHSWLRY